MTTTAPPAIRARKAGFIADVVSVAGRAIRQIPREPESVVPALAVPLFFFIVNTGSLTDITEAVDPGFDYKAFQLPVAIIFAVTGVSRASTLVTDIVDGYFDRLIMTPVSRLSLLLGLMIADFVLVAALCVPVIGLGFAVGVRFETGVLGILLFIFLAASWGLVFTGFPYAIALKTGNPAAVNSSFILFFPFAFLTTAFVPREAMTGWLDVVAGYNPVTYLLDALRSIVSDGWDVALLGKGALAIAAVGALSMSLALAALRGRVSRG
ncbi:MAG TPA: ABC transporter permease [Acidimicrobiales bacterium]|nr:ABC transporter permease [Acidimicrobiales bacterium]